MLTNQEVIDRVSTTMIPVVLDYEILQVPEAKETKFLLPLMKQRDQDQGVWIFSPEGKALGGFVGFDRMVQRTQEVIEDALKAFGPVNPRRAEAAAIHPFRGRGVMSDGSVCLAEYVRRTGDLAHAPGKAPVISKVTLSEQEFKALAPAEAVVGTKWDLPDDVSKRFSRVTSPMCYQHAPQPDWVTGARIHARVESVRDGVALVRYEGKISSVHTGHGGQKVSAQQVTLAGEGVYDVKTRAMRSVLLVGSGTLRWPEAPEKRVTFDSLVEWVLEEPGSSSKR